MTAHPALARLESLASRGMKLGLAAIDALCERLDRPERSVPCVLVAGTNGKGSTAATLASIATAAGCATGLYISPHLVDLTERIRYGAEDVAAEELDVLLAEVFAACDRAPEIPVTYFEAMTAAAFLGFARRRLDLAVLEVGLGGRYDATNVAPAELSIVTSISLDHVEDLGPTVAAIAMEKAGIFRAGRPALSSSDLPEARRALRLAAERSGARLHDMREETTLRIEESSLDGTRLRLRTPVRDYALATPLPGRHQADNTATAVRAAELLEPDFRFAPWAVETGVAAVRWPGRLERFTVRGRTLLLDGCHNADGAASLARFLVESGLDAELVFGAMADKDVEAMVGVLSPVARSLRIVPVRSPRGATPAELVHRVRSSRPDAIARSSLVEALEELLADARVETIIVAGSLYLVGEARALLLSGRLERT
jgi:dihydrofolate synthase/folylpolyglutamate synthase